MALVFVAVAAGVGYAVWQAPALLERLRAKTGDRAAAQSRTGADAGSRAAAGSPTQAVSSSAEILRLQKENEALRTQIRQLRDELKRTSDAVAQKNTEIEDLKLRLLIREKMSPKDR